MHDLPHFRKNFEQMAARLATRSNPPNLDKFRELDGKRRSAITQTEQLKARVNEQSSEIGKRRKEGVDTSGQQEPVSYTHLWIMMTTLLVRAAASGVKAWSLETTSAIIVRPSGVAPMFSTFTCGDAFSSLCEISTASA